MVIMLFQFILAHNCVGGRFPMVVITLVLNGTKFSLIPPFSSLLFCGTWGTGGLPRVSEGDPPTTLPMQSPPGALPSPSRCQQPWGSRGAASPELWLCLIPPIPQHKSPPSS